MARLFANNATSTLASGINDTDNTILLATGEGARFPSPSGGSYFLITLTQGVGQETSWEIVKCTARSGDTLTVARAQEGTSAAAWIAGSKAEARLTAGAIDEISGTINNIVTATTNTTLTSTPTLLKITPTGTGVVVTLPDATTCTEGGPLYIIDNASSYALTIETDDASRMWNLPARTVAIVSLADNATAAGDWSIANADMGVPIEYLVVGGGGAGGTGDCGGGGGGGEVATGSGTLAYGTAHTITVGAGGTFSSATGGSSVLATLKTSVGGGRGGKGNSGSTAGSSGASGGGGGWSSQAGGSATAGYAGGNGSTSGGNGAAGGGGGAGGVGAAASVTTGGNGGAGVASSLSGASVTYGAGGGGGGDTTGGTGGTNAGNGGGNGANGTAGTANTGAGGGGCGGYMSGANGPAGGSGVVILRYSDTLPAAASTTGSPTITVSGGYRIYKFTASGSITF